MSSIGAERTPLVCWDTALLYSPTERDSSSLKMCRFFVNLISDLTIMLIAVSVKIEIDLDTNDDFFAKMMVSFILL